MNAAAITPDRLHDQRTWLYARFQRDQLQMTLDACQHLALREFESACRTAITAMEAVMDDCHSRLAF